MAEYILYPYVDIVGVASSNLAAPTIPSFAFITFLAAAHSARHWDVMSTAVGSIAFLKP